MHPYKNLPQESYWRTGVAEKIWSEVNFKPNARFKLGPQDRITTAGSCFAQHMVKNLEGLGLNHYVTEQAPPFLNSKRASELGFGVFSARYGNIYTARQLRQLIEFAFDLRERVMLYAPTANGYVDLLRQNILISRFDNLHDLECDREYHLQCVKTLFLNSKCFIFTLGLTEAWLDSSTQIIFPTCPGTKLGSFNPKSHKFINFRMHEVVEDLRWCIEFLKTHNPSLTWILSVSPVALSATATCEPVLIATATSKAILRAAAEEIYSQFDHCEYFPSLEITSSAASFGQFLTSDLRSISDRGVELVMRIFREAFVSLDTSKVDPPSIDRNPLNARIEDVVKAECDESFYDPNFSTR
jgi:hypothetical protein